MTDGRRAPFLKRTNFVFVILSFIVALALFIADYMVIHGFQTSEDANARYLSARIPALDLEAGSDYLTDRVRCFVVTGDRRYMDDFFEEVNVTKRRDTALSDLEELLQGSDSEAYEHLSTALTYSNELMLREYHAMRLMQEALVLTDVPDVIEAVALSEEELGMTPEEQRALAQELIFDEEYMSYKELIKENVRLCTSELINTASLSVTNASNAMDRLLAAQTALTVVMLLVVLLLVMFISTQVRKPLTRMVELMRKQETVPPSGAAELQFVTRTYNEILAENKQRQEQLAYEATHDPLTGLYNRAAYDMFRRESGDKHIALILVDVDEFKTVNDTYGHDVGDKILKKVAGILKGSFRSVDIICRIGGDEFVVIMTRADSSMGQLVLDKIEAANRLLQDPDDGLPKCSLSVGIAFSDRKHPQGDIFKDADTALYQVKEAGRRGARVY